MAKNRSASGQVRIISGQWRSRRLPIHDLEGLRPTTDRVRETLFNWLAGDIAGAHVLDCFGGSGALFFESLSRYAQFAHVIELQKSAAQQLQQNLQTLKCEPQRAQVTHGDTLQILAQQPQQQFDIVYIDPPFRKGLATQAITLLDQHHWLKDNAQIYVETESDMPSLAVPANWMLLKEKQAGQVTYRLYQYQP
ncbi:16S rRNA (guanine(966)-N(2))-methyltransferase RsmD [Shewanella waksmanii]|uniref:16S rRNA (guanine(966)-N(2))-methyltransferase RsmD n=1 Tax=Shewanella waksmanii TaxID=213783 RepID=UPI0037350257